jgi:multicomponent Na+:H+ antiporter subunit G
VNEALAAIFLTVGCLLQLLAAIGLCRLPRSTIRIHASSKASGLGLGLVLIGAAIHHQDWGVGVKCLLALVFISLASPVVAHVLLRISLFGHKQEKF